MPVSLSNAFCLLEYSLTQIATDNSDGLTIIDISEPTSPAYCFMLPRVAELYGDQDYALRYVVLDGRGYVSAYHPRDVEVFEELGLQGRNSSGEL